MPITNLEEKRNMAIQAGYTPEEIQQYETSKELTNTSPIQSAQPARDLQQALLSPSARKLSDILSILAAPASGFGSLVNVNPQLRGKVTSQLPGIGAATGSIAAGPIGAGAGAATGRSIQEIINQLGGLLDVGVPGTVRGIRGLAGKPELLGEQLSTAPQRVLPFLGEVGTQAGGATILDTALAGAGKLGGKILGPLGTKVKGVFPSSLAKQIQKFTNTLAPRFNNAIKATEGTKLDIAPVIDELERIKTEAIAQNPTIKEKITKAADTIIKRATGYGTTPNPGQAFNLSLGFSKDVFGEVGKERAKRGIIGIMENDMYRAAGSRLKDIVKTGLEVADPSIREVFNQYAAAKTFEKVLERPSTGAALGGIISGAAASLGFLLSSLGQPELATVTGLGGGGLGLSLLLKEFPYLNFLARQAVGTPLSALGSTPSRASLQLLLQNLLQPRK